MLAGRRVDLRIGIDVREIERNMTGIGRYLGGFIKYATNTSHEYFLYYSRSPQADLSCSNAKVRVLPSSKFLWDHITLPKALERDKIDLFFSPYYKKPWSLKCKSIITVHDLNPLFNKNSSFWYRVYFKKILKRSVYSADFILVVSNYVKKELLKIFRLDDNKVIVNYNAVDERFFRMDDNISLKAVLEKYSIKSDYILYVGNLMPHKNAPSLVEAYSQLPDEIKEKYKLVIGGSKNWTYEQLVKLVDGLGLVNNVIFAGFISNDDLVYLYNGASLFVFPSFREGFGFPPLEAMACGTPVITSNTTSLPEVIREAGILVNPYKVNEIKAAIIKVLTDSTLRNGLIKRGLEMSRRFTPKKTAEQILKIFTKVQEAK